MLPKSKHSQIQISYAWIFAVIVGAFILFIAIYSATKIIDIGERKASAEISKEFESLLNPLETGFESGTSVLIEMPLETRIYNSCSLSGNFGAQIMSLSQKTSRGWVETNLEFSSRNRYLFSENVLEGKNFFIFTKPFDFPFKVGDLMYLTSKDRNYCFFDAPPRIEEEISKLKQENLFVRNCPLNSIKICFRTGSGTSSGCDVVVNENLKSVIKQGISVYYETDALMYAAIFSDPNNYECNLKRLMKRAETLSYVYNEKASLISKQNCISEVNLLPLINSLRLFNISEDLVFVHESAKQVENENLLSRCRLW